MLTATASATPAAKSLEGNNTRTLTLELPPEVERALAEEARRKGTTPEQLVLKDLRQRYCAPEPRPDTMLELFAKWEAEDPITGLEDAAARQREGDEFMAALEAS